MEFPQDLYEHKLQNLRNFPSLMFGNDGKQSNKHRDFLVASLHFFVHSRFDPAKIEYNRLSLSRLP